ncbi:unnamed protein product, partial [Choristocarpus tenellus]
MFPRVVAFLAPVLLLLQTWACEGIDFTGIRVEVPVVVHVGDPFAVTLHLDPSLALVKNGVPIGVSIVDKAGGVEILSTKKVAVSAGGSITLQHEVDDLVLREAGSFTLRLHAGAKYSEEVVVICVPGWVSLLPPLITLVISILYQQVIVALLVGVWTGALLVSDFNPLQAFLRTFDTYFVGAFTEEGNAEVLLFTFLLGGTIGLVQRSGGAQGLANKLKHYMGSRIKGQLCTVALGCLIFFDDYSSILIVGNSLRDVVGMVQVSQPKFAWLVHSIGVALASLSPISSWVGLQIGYTKAVLGTLGLSSSLDGFLVVLSSLPYRFFPLFYLLFVIIVVFTGRDFGPMGKAEGAAAASVADASARGDLKGAGSSIAVDGSEVEGGGGIGPKAGTPLRSRNAFIPFSVVIGVTFVGMILDGIERIEAGGNQVPKTLVNILSSCDSVSVLIWASAAGWIGSLVLVCGQGILTLSEAMETWMEGMKARSRNEVLEPQFVLVLAWALGRVVKEVQTAEYLAGALESGIHPALLPALISVLCYVISYACGSTFGTMGIVFPLVGPLAWRLGGGDVEFLNHCFACILGSAIFGNVCSPISDTTILTSLATGCSLTDHIRTISPYTFIVGTLSIILGNIPVGLGLYGPWMALAIGAIVLTGLVYSLGEVPS